MGESQKEKIEFRVAVAEDAPAIVKYIDDIYDEGIDTVHPPRRSVEEQAAVLSAWAEGRSFNLIALLGAKVVGQLVLAVGNAPHNRHMGSFGVAILEEARGMGVGTQLIQMMEERARTYPGFCRIELEVMPRNEAAHRLYTRLGYVEEGRKRKSANTTGTPEDTIIMAKVW